MPVGIKMKGPFRRQAFGGGWQESDAKPCKFFLPGGFELGIELIITH